MNIGKRLKAYREYHQLTQEDLATKAGVNEKYVWKHPIQSPRHF